MVKKWYTKSEYVDVHTGEMITESKVIREYIKLKTSKKVKINGEIGEITHTWECEKDRQTKLF